MELRTQTNGTRIVKSGYSALEYGLPFFSAIYIPINDVTIKDLFIVAKDINGVYQEYDYKREYENTYDFVIPCCSGLNVIESRLTAGVWIFAPTGFEFSRIVIEQGYAIIY